MTQRPSPSRQIAAIVTKWLAWLVQPLPNKLLRSHEAKHAIFAVSVWVYDSSTLLSEDFSLLCKNVVKMVTCCQMIRLRLVCAFLDLVNDVINQLAWSLSSFSFAMVHGEMNQV